MRRPTAANGSPAVVIITTALAITPSHQQNTHDFADGRKNMNDIFNNHIWHLFAVRPICVQDSIFKMSSESPDY